MAMKTVLRRITKPDRNGRLVTLLRRVRGCDTEGCGSAAAMSYDGVQERFCMKCRRKLVKKMKRDGYFTEVPTLPRPDTLLTEDDDEPADRLTVEGLVDVADQ